MNKFLIVCALCSTVFSHSTLARSSHPGFASSNQLRVGALYQDTLAGIRGDSANDENAAISIEAIGIDREQWVPQLVYNHHFKNRWQVNLFLSSYTKSGDNNLDQPIKYFDTTYDAGLKVDSKFSINTAAVTVSYDLYRTNTKALKMGIGVHALELKTSIDAQANGSPTDDTARRSAEEDLVAPLPNISVGYKQAFGNEWLARIDAAWLSASIDSYRGELIVAEAALEYQITSRIGAGVGYQYNSVDVKRTKSDIISTYDVRYSGPSLYLIWNF